MTNKAWFALLAAGLFGGALVMGGCVVGDGDDDDDTGGTGGISSGGTGNSSSGGTGNSTSGGGTAGSTGGSAGATGGTGGTTLSCNPTGSTPNTCTATDPNNTCQTCVEQNCCTEYSACYGTDPDDSCGWGGPANWPNEGGELLCMQDCIITAGVADDTTIGTCANACLTDGCGTISPQTSDTIGCMKDLCFADCLQP